MKGKSHEQDAIEAEKKLQKAIDTWHMQMEKH